MTKFARTVLFYHKVHSKSMKRIESNREVVAFCKGILR